MSVKKLDTHAIGVNSREEPIEAIVSGQYHSSDNIHRIALISGLSGGTNSQEIHREAIQTLLSYSQEISFIGSDFTEISSTLAEQHFPPEDGYFSDKNCPESRYIWRWLTMEAPDMVIEVENGPNLLIERFPNDAQDGSLLSALATHSSKAPGPIPGIRITCTAETVDSEISSILGEILNADPIMSGARSELEKRSSRTALQTAKVLAKTYGHKLEEPINYIQGVAISGRLRLKELDSTYQDPTDDIIELVEFLTNDADFKNNNISGPNMAAMCWANELFAATGDRRWRNLTIKAADCYQQGETGNPPLYMAKNADQGNPDFGCEDMFFISSMCGRAFEMTKDRKYLDSYVSFLLESNTQQDSGLFWHCRSAPFLWGRGNGFAALAFAEGLTFIPDNHPSRDTLISMHNKHMEGLSSLQQSTGMWTQLLDFPGTYQELSVTSMVGYALARGLRMGWLSEKFLPMLNKAWEGVNRRISENADLVDVCTGTGFQENRSDYLYREAEYGYDDRGGSMAIWFSTEMESLIRSRSNN